MDISGIHAHGGTHEPTGVAGVDALGLALRLVLLLSTALVAGTAVLRPTVDAVSRRALVTTCGGATVGLAALALSVALREVSTTVAVVHALLLAVTAAVLSRWALPAAASASGLGIVLVVETVSGYGAVGPPVAVLTVIGAAWLGLTMLSVTGSEQHHFPRLRWPRLTVLATAAVIAIAGIGPLLLSDVLGDRRIVTSRYGHFLLLIAALSVAVLLLTTVVLRRGGAWRAYQTGGVAVVAALLSSWVLPGIPPPTELPRPGTALITHASVAGSTVPVLVTPQRPGRNLVHFPERAGSGIEVVGSNGPVRSERRAGAKGTWAEVDLPTGRSTLGIRQGPGGHGNAFIEVDTGSSDVAVAGSTGPDGPECASAALAAWVAGSRDVVGSCPSTEFTADDKEALQRTVGYLASRKAPRLALRGDESPRSVQAADAVRDAAAQHGIPVHTTPQQGDAVLLVSGWDAAQRELDTIRGRQARDLVLTHGVYLAPWLLNAPLTNSVATASVPLRFDPRDRRSLQYGMALDTAFPGEAPSVAGFEAWLRTRGQQLTDPVSIYASAQVDVMKMDMPGMSDTSMHGSTAVGQWNPHGTVIAISEPLQG